MSLTISWLNFLQVTNVLIVYDLSWASLGSLCTQGLTAFLKNQYFLAVAYFPKSLDVTTKFLRFFEMRFRGSKVMLFKAQLVPMASKFTVCFRVVNKVPNSE